MTLLFEASQEKRFDLRVVERNLRRGIVAPEEFKKSTDKVADDASNAEYTRIEDLAVQEDEN